MKVAVVGPCASGKTELVRGLCHLGYEAFSVSQEHSEVRRLFRHRLPDAVVFLSATYPVIAQRRKISWGESSLAAQAARLEWARQEADLVIDTDHLSANDVLVETVRWLGSLDGGSRGPDPMVHPA